MINKEILDLDVVKNIEKDYPEMTNEFKKIVSEQYLTFCKKQTDYGPTNISLGSKLETDDDIKLSLSGVWFRINDKIQRLKQLVLLNKKQNVEDESSLDTYKDITNYAIISQIILNKKWGK